MKLFYALLGILLFSSMTQAQIVEIPDPFFKFALVNYLVVDTDDDGVPDSDVDTNDDGEIQESEALATLSLYPRGSNISDLDGIQAFTNLKILNCSQNAISSLDLSQNPDLEELACFFNNLTNLDLTLNTKLKFLECDFNDLAQLNLTQNPDLESLRFAFNDIAEIDLSQNLALKSLDGDSNNLVYIDLENNVALASISLDKNELTQLDVSQNLALSFLDVNNNSFDALNLSLNSMLTKFWCFGCELENLNIQNGNNMALAIFNVGDNPNLQCIQVDDPVFANNQTSWIKDEVAAYSDDCLLGNQDFNLDSITIYPNPAGDFISIRSNNDVAIEQVDLYDVRGHLIFTEQTNFKNLDTSMLGAGVFFAIISSEMGSLTKKLIKK